MGSTVEERVVKLTRKNILLKEQVLTLNGIIGDKNSNIVKLMEEIRSLRGCVNSLESENKDLK
jgi:hypothetical protein